MSQAWNGRKPVPAAELDGASICIERNTITGTGRDGKTFLAVSYVMDGTASPAKLKLTSREPTAATVAGLAKRDGDTVTIVYHRPGSPAPTGFTTAAGQQLFVLKRVEDPKNSPEKANSREAK